MEIEYYNLINKLPEEVLLHVISFLPLKEAVKTSVLSTSWRALWRPYIVNVDLDSDKIMQEISKFLHTNEAPELLRLFYQIPHDDKMKEKSDILAAKGVDKELFLDFSNEEQEKEKEAYILRLRHPSNVASFVSLKTLHVKSVTHTDKQFFSVLFSNSRVLECLKIEKCCDLHCLDLTAGASLENVMVLDCPDMSEISISSSNLKSFTYKGVLPQVNIKNSPNLIDVTLDSSEGLGQNEFDCEEILSLLESIRNIEILSISGWLIEVVFFLCFNLNSKLVTSIFSDKKFPSTCKKWLCSAGVIFQRLDFHFNSLKQLHVSEPCMNRSKLDSLVFFLEICPSVDTLCIKIDHDSKDLPCPYFYQCWHKPYFGVDDAVLKPMTCSRLDFLRVGEVAGFGIQEFYGLRLLDVLLRRALLLNSVAVKSWDDILWEVIKFPLSQLKIVCGNKPDIVAVLSPNKDYYLGFLNSPNKTTRKDMSRTDR